MGAKGLNVDVAEYSGRRRCTQRVRDADGVLENCDRKATARVRWWHVHRHGQVKTARRFRCKDHA
jgi:hypothetical protein